MTDASTTRHASGEGADVGELMARYDEELPARRLSGRVALAVTVLCFGVAVFVVRQGFWPLSAGNQYYLMLILAFVLPLIFLCYRPVTRRARADLDSPLERRTDNPGPADWALAAVALLACLYPVLPVT